MQNSVNLMMGRLAGILGDNLAAVYLTGSAALGDFREGWSDIDILCFAKNEFSTGTAEKIVNLRQQLEEEHPGNTYFKKFEGGIMPLCILKGEAAACVYWGTSGQKITDSYDIGVFAAMELIDSGVLLRGNDIREKIEYPTAEMIRSAVLNHYDTVRKYAVPRESLYSAGWMLDIARCIYTVRTGKIIGKTMAGEWAIEQRIVPDEAVMERIVEIRKDPLKYRGDKMTLKWIAALGEEIQRFADVLEKELAI